ncbi:MAG: prolipoprotein diacylglyceryl transferase [Lachnospiraceae bacterium]|nr:prolipoprotein diacylglyceryl transferase [Lachnospiraceae bacterium]
MFSWWDNRYGINFPKLGISLGHVPRGFTIGGFNIAFYGVIIAFGMIGGLLLARWQAKRSGQDPELYSDFALIAIPCSVIGARLYSVAFEWKDYKNDLLQIFNLRNGGLAIYGGVIVAFLCVFIYAKVKKINPFVLLDTGIVGLILGQLVGRWGNFFNRECFGNYTESLFAMQIPVADQSLSNYFKPEVISDTALAQIYAGKERALESIMQIRNNLVAGADGLTYVQVQPTFLYESLWNLALLIILLIYWRHKKFDGEIGLLYLLGYGLGRLWIEGLRTDQLFLWRTGIAVSQLLSGLLVVVSLGLIIFFRIRAAKLKTVPMYCDYGNKRSK